MDNNYINSSAMQMGSKNKSRNLWRIIALAGTIIVVLTIILIVIITGDDTEKQAEGGAMEIGIPENAFIYNPEEEYGGNLKISSELDTFLFGDASDLARDEIMRRVSAFFAINYPEISDFGMMKDSNKEMKRESSLKREVILVSNNGLLVKFEMLDEINDMNVTSTGIKLLRLSGDEIYKTEINWEEQNV